VILLDTCVISEALRPFPSPEVLRWIESLPESSVAVPALVVGELQKGVESLAAGTKRDALRLWLEQFRSRFAERIVACDEETSIVWGALVARMERAGRPLPAIDSLLAATALRHAATLATRNTSDYEGTGVTVVNPWGCRSPEPSLPA
jgi:toxin FitB